MLELEESVAALALALARRFVAFFLFTGFCARQPHRFPIAAAAAACTYKTTQIQTQRETERERSFEVVAGKVRES